MEFVHTAYAAEDAGISIHLAPTVLGTVFGIPITNTMLTVWLSMTVLVVLALVLRARLASVPGRVQTACESLFELAYEYMKEVLGSERFARVYFPLIMTIFLFVLAMNWISLLPGMDSLGFHGMTMSHDGTAEESFIPFFHSAATDLNVTLALALISVFVIELSGIFILGLFRYGGKFFNFTSPLNFAIGIIELFSEAARLVAFAFRLFGNIFAGKTLLLVVMFFVPFVLPVPLLAFEVFVGFIQAFIFAILTLYFIKLAITDPHGSHEH